MRIIRAEIKVHHGLPTTQRMAVLQEPDLRKLPDGRFKLVTAFACEMDDGRQFVVPSRFVTDFASSRVGAVNFLSVKAGNSYAAVLHDWLYATGTVSRAQADLYFREGLKSEGNGRFQCWKAYWGVRLGGQHSWNEHRRKQLVTP